MSRKRFFPTYDKSSDFKTNAKSYFDALAKTNKQIKVLGDFINKLLDRDIKVENTKSVNITKDGDWQNEDDIITLKADVNTSSETEQLNQFQHIYKGSRIEVPNNTKIKDDGVFSRDYLPVLRGIDTELGVVKQAISDLEIIGDGGTDWSGAIDGALQEATDRIAQAKLELEQAMIDLDTAMQVADDAIDNVINNPQSYKGHFTGDVGITGELHVVGEIIGGEGATIRGTLNAQQLNLRQANILNANIEDAQITGTLSSVDGTFIGDLVGARIFSAGTTFVGTDLTVSNNIYLGDSQSSTAKKIQFNAGATIFTDNGIGSYNLNFSALQLNLESVYVSLGEFNPDPQKLRGIIAVFGDMETTETETGHMGVGGFCGLTSPNSPSTTSLMSGVNFRIKKTYTPTSISYVTTAISSSTEIRFVDITSDGFTLVADSTTNVEGLRHFRGKYTA